MFRVSPEGGIIRDLVRQPMMQRKPVGYQRTFLEEYEPGVTFYLPASLRAGFHEMGRTPAGKRPAGTYAREILNRLLIDLSWASSRLEGNTYNRLDTQNVRLFGSWAKGTATASSDLDLLVDLVPGRDLFDLIGMKQEIEAVTGFKVDVVTENSLSKHFREKILHEAKPL